MWQKFQERFPYFVIFLYALAMRHLKDQVEASSELQLRSSRAESNWQLRATVGQNSSSVQMASAYHVGAAILAHVARRGQLDSALDERSLSDH